MFFFLLVFFQRYTYIPTFHRVWQRSTQRCLGAAEVDDIQSQLRENRIRCTSMHGGTVEGMEEGDDMGKEVGMKIFMYIHLY